MQFQIHLQTKITVVLVKSALKRDITTTDQHLKIDPADKYGPFHLHLAIERKSSELIETPIHWWIKKM